MKKILQNINLTFTTYKFFLRIRLLLLYVLNFGFCKTATVLNDEQTIQKIITENLSVSRFGDGELVYIFGFNHAWQRTETELIDGLRGIFKLPEKKLLVCVPDFLLNDRITRVGLNSDGWRSPKFALRTLIQSRQQFGSAFAFRPKNCELGSNPLDQLQKFVEYLRLRNIIYLGTNDSYKKYISPRQIIDSISKTNSFSEYEHIIKTIKVASANYENPIVIASCGITASLLCSDLSSLGIQAIDIGSFFDQYTKLLECANTS